MNPETPANPQTDATPAPIEDADLEQRRAELTRELRALSEKSRSYGNELWSDGRHLVGSSLSFAKAAATWARTQVAEYVQKSFGRADREAAQS